MKHKSTPSKRRITGSAKGFSYNDLPDKNNDAENGTANNPTRNNTVNTVAENSTGNGALFCQSNPAESNGKENYIIPPADKKISKQTGKFIEYPESAAPVDFFKKKTLRSNVIYFAVCILISAGLCLGLYFAYGYTKNIYLVSLLFGIAVLVLSAIFFIVKVKKPQRQLERVIEELDKLERGGNLNKLRNRKFTEHYGSEMQALINSLNVLLAEFTENEKEIRELIARVSHELRTPIAATIAEVENLADGIIPANHENLEEVLSNMNVLSNLVEYLLDVSRLELSGQAKLSKSKFFIDDFLEDCVRPLATYQGTKNLYFIIDVRPKDLQLYADRNRLTQVIMNLVANAIKHSPDNGKVVLQALKDSKDVIINVIDEGSGIPKKDRERVFKRFTQVEKDSSGTGLGLSIVKWAIDLHGGKVRVVEIDGKNAIQIVLPNAGGIHQKTTGIHAQR